MTVRLIGTSPTRIHTLGKDEYLFQFGEDAPAVGDFVGMVFLTTVNPHYTRFKVIPSQEAGAPPVYLPVGTRPLTGEERAHFQALVAERVTQSPRG